jgi:Zn-finger protein
MEDKMKKKSWQVTSVPCEKCHSNRWKTNVKGKEWECRSCGKVRVKKDGE